MGFISSSALLVAGLFFGMILLFEVGRRAAVRQMRTDTEGTHSGTGVIESAVFGLLALLVGFTFLGAAERFDHRRDLVVDEANKIGTAYLRLDMLGGAERASIQEAFRTYLDSRLDFYRNLTDETTAVQNLQETQALQLKIWQDVVAASKTNPDASRLILPALNEMIDITTTRTMAMRMHPPMIIFVMLFGIALASALFAGHGMAKARKRNWLHIGGFAAVMAISIYVILDMEYPRQGLIRVDEFDQALVEVRQSMK